MLKFPETFGKQPQKSNKLSPRRAVTGSYRSTSEPALTCQHGFSPPLQASTGRAASSSTAPPKLLGILFTLQRPETSCNCARQIAMTLQQCLTAMTDLLVLVISSFPKVVYLCTWNEHCQQKLYTDNLESYTGRISWAIFQKKKCVGRLHALTRWVLLFLVLYLSLEVLCQPDASPWHLPRADSSSWETHSFAKRSGEEFNKVWVYLCFREICNRYFCICHMYVSAFFFVNVGSSQQSLKVIIYKL